MINSPNTEVCLASFFLNISKALAYDGLVLSTVRYEILTGCIFLNTFGHNFKDLFY